MTALSKRRSKLCFETDAEFRERGKSRPIIIEAEGYIAYVRLKGLRQKFAISWDDVYATAVKRHADRERAEKNKLKAEKRKR